MTVKQFFSTVINTIKENPKTVAAMVVEAIVVGGGTYVATKKKEEKKAKTYIKENANRIYSEGVNNGAIVGGTIHSKASEEYKNRISESLGINREVYEKYERNGRAVANAIAEDEARKTKN